jgi:hypothetical protein
MFAGVALRFCVVHSFPPVAEVGRCFRHQQAASKGHRINDYSAELISIDIGFTLMIHA